MNSRYEVLVIGAGPAGLGAAMALARLRRSMLVCDDARPRNGPAAHIHNVPGAERLSPAEWRRKARADVAPYPSVEFFDGAVTRIEKGEGGFEATLEPNRTVRVQRLVLAYGIRDRLPEIPGVQELWGKSVFHCPFCHGYENRDGKIGLVADGDKAMHALTMLSALTSDLILFTNAPSQLTSDQRDVLRRRRVRVVEQPVERFVHEDGNLQGVLVDGRLMERTGIMVTASAPAAMKSAIAQDLGCEITEAGLYKVDEGNRTTVAGVYAAGDNMSGMQSVVAACAAGQLAGATAAMDILRERFEV